MEAYLTQISNYLLRQSWQIAILVMAVAAVSWLLRNKSAHIRYLLWLIVLAKCLVPPVTTVPLGILPQESVSESALMLPTEEPIMTAEIVDMFDMESPAHRLAPAQRPSIPIATERAVRLTVRQRLGAAWIAGVIIFALIAVTKALRTELWLRRQRKPLPVKLKSEIEDLLACFRIRTLPQVWLVEGIGQPFVWGVLHGSIYLPGNFVKVNSSENRRGVLGHELSHVMRFDTVVNLLQVISQAIFWFHPLVWWANKRIRAEREKCCDEMAIACLGAKAKDYSSAIVNMLITEHKSTRPVPSLAVAGPVKNIEERIKTMTRPGKKFYKRPSLIAATAVLLLALLSVPTTFVLTARAQRPEPVAAESVEAGGGTSITVVSDQNSDAGDIPEANLQIPNDLKPCAEVLRTIYDALKRYEKDKGSLPDWLSDLVPDYLSAEILIWPEDDPRSTPLAADPHLPCSFGYQYSSLGQVSGRGMSYRQFKDQERQIWGNIVPLVRYYKGQKCLNLSFDGRVYFSGTPWEREIPTLSGQILADLQTTSVPASPRQVLTPTGARPWGPEQATGAPDTQGAGDFPNAWAPLEADAGPEWLKVDFERAVKIAALRVRESFNPGAISKIGAIVEDGREHVLWGGWYPTSEVSADIDFVLRVLPTGDVPLYVKGYSGFSVLQDIELKEDVVSKSIKIYLDTSRKRGWNEIDAVQLFGKDGSKQWACEATASSTHATGITRISVSRRGEGLPAAPTKIQPGGARGKVLAFDDFEGKLSLKWDVLNPDKSHYSLSNKPGALTITTQDGHFKEANADYENVFLIDTPASPDQDFQITTCLLAFQPLEPYHQAGLICWDDEDNYLEWVYQKMDRRGLNFNAGVEANGPTQYTYIPADGSFEKLWLRVTKRGNSYQCASSTDGRSFTVHAVESWGDGSPRRIGLFALNGSLTHPPEVDASFDFFEVSSALAAPARAQVQAPAGKTAAFTVAGDTKKVFEGEYLHRSRGRDYLRTKLTKSVCVDGAILYSLKMGEAAYSFLADKDGRPRQYKYDYGSRPYSCTYHFSKGSVRYDRQMGERGSEEFDWTVNEGTMPDFNSRPDPYLVQHVLVQAYDRRQGGKQTFIVYDIDNGGKNLNEYQITLEIVGEADVTLPNGRFKAKHFVQVQQTPGNTWYKKGPGSKTEYWVDDDGVILRIYRHSEPYEVILTDYGQQPLAESGTPGFTIPQANLQIPGEMKGCAENLQAIYAALKEYEKDKGRMPDWLSQLVPLRLGRQTLFCTLDSSRKSSYWPDPNLPCSYCYELNPTELRSRPPLDKTMRHYKTLQRKLFGDVVPIVRCFHHGRVLNLSWNGQLYTSAVMFERLFIPDYSHNMLFEAEPTKVVPSGEPQYETDLKAFIQEMDRTYPFFDLKGIRDDWDKTKKQLQQKVRSCKSDGQFLEIATEAILCLRDSHMWFRGAKAQLPQRPKRYYPGIGFMPATNERVLVMSCREGLDPDLKTGTIISRIDGKNARYYLEERAKARWAEGGISGPQRARLFAYRIPLCGEKKGEKHTITILADGKQRQVELSSDMEAGGWPHWYNRPSDLKQVDSCSYTILPSGIGYIYLRRIDGSTGPGMKEAFSTYSEAKGWIVDLCGNGGGGYDQTLHEVLRALPSPLAVIIDAGCMSAGETMARDLAQQGKARLFGSKTAGASSSKRIWTFPSGIASLSLPARSRWGIDGKPIEFLGIEPHVKVEAVPEELKRGLNSAILRAEEYITEITSAQTQ